MYCSECGKLASGKFCSNCGTQLAPAQAGANPPAGDWSREVRYDVLIAHPQVREILAQAGRGDRPHISADVCMKFYDKFVAKAVGGVELSDLATIAVPIFTRMGIKTTKERTESIAAPAGRTIVAVLCSLAARGNTIKDVHQARDGCAIEAVLPSDFWSWEGTLLVSICAQGDFSRLDAHTTVGGQLHDWGKSARRLEQLVSDVRAFQMRTFAA